MDYALKSDESHRFYYAFETTFGTPVALSGSFKELEIEKSQFPDLGVQTMALGNNRASRVLNESDSPSDNYSGPVTVSFTSYASKDRLADLLYLVMQNRVSEGGATAYQKVYRPHASQPDFSVNAGAFITGIWKSPITGKDIRLTSGILKNLSVSFDKSGSGQTNLVKVSGQFMFKKYEVDVTFSGTVATRSMTLAYKAHDFALEVYSASISSFQDWTELNWEKFSLTIDNGAVGVDKDASGYPATFFLYPNDGVKGSLDLWYTPTTEVLLGAYSSGYTFDFRLTKGTDGVDGYVQIAIHVRITKTPLGSTNNQMRMPLDLQMMDTSGATTGALTVTLSDSISQA